MGYHGNKESLSLIFELENFANTQLRKVTKFQGDSLFRSGVLSHYWAGGGKHPLPPHCANTVKDRFLSSCPNLVTYKSGRDVFVSFREGIGAILQNAYTEDADDEGTYLAKAANIVRHA